MGGISTNNDHKHEDDDFYEKAKFIQHNIDRCHRLILSINFFSFNFET